jgi:hypothetical protein
MSDPRRRILHNPFYVLGVPVQASRAEVEREGQKLLGMLALGLSAACTYDSPLGPAPRTPEAVREAMAELRDPERRLIHELWARVPAIDAAASIAGAGTANRAAGPAVADAAGAAVDATGAAAAAPWPDALPVLGWQPPARSRSGA